MMMIQDEDVGRPPLSSESELMIDVTDVNDCRPMFTSDDYTVTVVENSSPGLSIFQLTAVDADLPGSPNSQLSYDLRPRTDGERAALAVDPVYYINYVTFVVHHNVILGAVSCASYAVRSAITATATVVFQQSFPDIVIIWHY